jgi:hypothetical protein
MMVVSYFVSPCGEESADGQDGDNDDPFVGVMLSVDGFIKSEVASPIWESAVPVLQYRAGETVRVELTREFLKTAMEIADELEVPNLQSRLFGDVNPHLNLYRALLATYE